MRSVLIALVVLLLAAAAPVRAASENTAVKAALARDVASINLTNVTLSDAIDYLRDLTGANISVHWKTLELVHVTKESPVNVRLRHVSMRKALQLILAEAGPQVPLTYYLDQGVIEITTRDAADAKMITRVYDVSDLIMEIPNFEGPGGFDLGSKTGKNSGGGGASSGGLFNNQGGAKKEEKSATAQERGDQLVNVITSVIRPDIWQANGGAAAISFFRGRLIITAPRSVHEAIGGPVE